MALALTSTTSSAASLSWAVLPDSRAAGILMMVMASWAAMVAVAAADGWRRRCTRLRREGRAARTRLASAWPASVGANLCPSRFRPSYDRPTAAPAHTRACTADPGEVYTFRTHETQTGRALSLPQIG